MLRILFFHPFGIPGQSRVTDVKQEGSGSASKSTAVLHVKSCSTTISQRKCRELSCTRWWHFSRPARIIVTRRRNHFHHRPTMFSIEAFVLTGHIWRSFQTWSWSSLVSSSKIDAPLACQASRLFGRVSLTGRCKGPPNIQKRRVWRSCHIKCICKLQYLLDYCTKADVERDAISFCQKPKNKEKIGSTFRRFRPSSPRRQQWQINKGHCINPFRRSSQRPQNPCISQRRQG